MPVSQDVRKTLDDYIAAMSAGDFDAIARLTGSSPDVVGIGSDPDEWWVGRRELLGVIETQMREMAGARWEVGDVAGSGSWAAAPCSVSMPDGARADGRLTIVCAPDGTVEHFHFSVGVSNEEAIGQELTT